MAKTRLIDGIEYEVTDDVYEKPIYKHPNACNRGYCPNCNKNTENTCHACGCGHCVECGHRFCCLPPFNIFIGQSGISPNFSFIIPQSGTYTESIYLKGQ